MLFITKSGVRKQVAENTKLFIRTVEAAGGIPKSFWGDPKILGYLTGCISGLISIIGRGKYKGGDLGLILMGVFDDLAGQGRGFGIAKTATAMMSSPAFTEAASNGTMSVMISTYGPEKVASEPIVIRSLEHATKTKEVRSAVFGSSINRGDLVASMHQLCFYDRVLELQDQELGVRRGG